MAMVSCQEPLSDKWLSAPLSHSGRYVRALEPDSKSLIPPMEARRMDRLMKRAVCTSLTALREASLSMPDGIITATGGGCLETSERFLTDMVRFGESCLKPTLFMQSTHNTLGARIAIMLRCHGYNNTLSQGEISMESALLDARLQMLTANVRNLLVGAHDEVTPLMASVMERVYPEMQLVSETSVSMVLDTDPDNALCEVSRVELFHHATPAEVAAVLASEIHDGVLLMLGTNGNPANDAPYDSLVAALGYTADSLSFKPLFGENFSASAAGIYAAARMLAAGVFPTHLWRREAAMQMPQPVNAILIVNHSADGSWGAVKLSKPSLR